MNEMDTTRYFIGRKPPVANAEYRIPYGTQVKVIAFKPRRRAIVEYRGEKIITFTYLLRRKNPFPFEVEI